jgi:hypothetical protein
VTITPEGDEVGHYRSLTSSLSSCPHRPDGRSPDGGER